MAEPPKSPPSSDIEGVNRDARAGQVMDKTHPDPGGAIQNAKAESKAKPDEGKPEE